MSDKPKEDIPDLIVTRGDGIPLPDQKAALEEFKRQALHRDTTVPIHTSGGIKFVYLSDYDALREELAAVKAERKPYSDMTVSELQAVRSQIDMWLSQKVLGWP